jgi:hypothetical protein
LIIMSTPRKGRKTTRKKRGTVTARRFFDLVVLVLGEKCSFTANTAVPMAEAQAEVARRSDLTDAERKAYDEKYIKRRIEFAFRNRRAKYAGNMEPLTVLVNGQGGQWGLTEAGVKRAKELSSGDLVDGELPPEPGDPKPKAAAPRTVSEVLSG